MLFDMGYQSVFMLLPPLAEEFGFTDREGSLLVTIFGLADLTGRIFFGWFGDRNLIKLRFIFLWNIAVCSLGIILTPHITSYVGICVFVALYGIFAGGFNGLVIPMVVECLGREHLSSAFGFALFGVSISMLINPTISGMYHV
jgi:MFS family permease